ncbi:MAG: hypothetical protein R2873_24320 [Caldilineaceae bacterium]
MAAPLSKGNATYADRRFTVLVDARIGQVRVEWHAPVVESEDEAVAPVKSLQESKGGANPYLRTMT